MLSPPPDLGEDTLLAALAGEWAVTVSAARYRPLGFGSHHWEIRDTGGTRWFVTVDEPASFDRLWASLATATRLRDHGNAFAVAPIATAGGEPLVRLGRFGVALYPYVAGESFGWGEFSSAEHRQATLDLVVAVHTASAAVRQLAITDDLTVAYRAELFARNGADHGPYSRRAADLLTEHEPLVRRLFARYDALVAAATPGREVLTHGEPHPGNTMRTPAGWRLIDWDTALLAAPERDLWLIEPGDGSVLAAYAAATGVTPQAHMLELYRLRWDLNDLGELVSRFHQPHPGDANDDESWEMLRTLPARLGSVEG